jgi:hypothetical protein
VVCAELKSPIRSAAIKAPFPSAANLLASAGFCAADLTAVLRLCISLSQLVSQEPRREAEVMDNVSIQKAIELRDSLLAELRQNHLFQALPICSGGHRLGNSMVFIHRRSIT